MGNPSIEPPERPDIPAEVPYEIANLMQTCWAVAPAERPSFENLDAKFKVLEYVLAAVLHAHCIPLYFTLQFPQNTFHAFCLCKYKRLDVPPLHRLSNMQSHADHACEHMCTSNPQTHAYLPFLILSSTIYALSRTLIPWHLMSPLARTKPVMLA